MDYPQAGMNRDHGLLAGRRRWIDEGVAPRGRLRPTCLGPPVGPRVPKHRPTDCHRCFLCCVRRQCGWKPKRDGRRGHSSRPAHKPHIHVPPTSVASRMVPLIIGTRPRSWPGTKAQGTPAGVGVSLWSLLACRDQGALPEHRSAIPADSPSARIALWPAGFNGRARVRTTRAIASMAASRRHAVAAAPAVGSTAASSR